MSSPTPQATATAPQSSRPPGAGPARRRRALSVRPSLLDAALLGALVVAATCLYTFYALKIGSFQPDEWYYMELARYIAGHFPAGLWQEGIYWRGIQRIDQLVLAAPFALLRGASVYEAAHVIQALLYASAAIPVWLLARAAGLSRWARALAAAIVLLAPWAIVSTSFLAEGAAYPAYAWVLYTTWLAARGPTRRRELLALLALAAAAFSRTALLGIAPILPLAVLWQQWRWELRGLRWRARIAALPRALWSRAPIVTAIALLGLAALLLSLTNLMPGGGLGALTGSYGLPQRSALSGLLGRYAYYLSRMALGTGVIALPLGLAWALRALVRPREGGGHALAAVCVLGVGVVLLSLVQAGQDERYVLYGAAPIALAFAAELQAQWRRSPAPGRRAALARALGLGLAAAFAIAVLADVSWPPAEAEYDFFAYPAATFYARAVGTRLASVHVGASAFLVVVVAVAAVAWLLAGIVRRMTRPAAVLAAAATLLLCATELVYSLQKFTTGPAAIADGAEPEARSWLERVVRPGTRVAAVGIGLGAGHEYVPIWHTTEFWNTAIDEGVAFRPWEVPPVPFGAEGRLLAVQSPSGRLSIVPQTTTEAGHTPPVPRYLLLSRQDMNPYGFVATPVANDPVLPLSLVRLSQPARLQWSLSGTSPEGFMSPRGPAIATVYRDALAGGARCASFQLIAPVTYNGPTFPGSWPYVVSAGAGQTVRGRLAAQQTRQIEVRLLPRAMAGGGLARVTVRVHGSARYVNGKIVSARLAGFEAHACARRR